MQKHRKAFLTLQNGDVFEGYSFGYEKPCAGEVVFNTAMTGYPESLTDPSYEGQILVTTYPILGNYGVPSREVSGDDKVIEYFESSRIHCEAIICQDYSSAPSHWLSQRPLSDWLIEEKIPGLFGIDTRHLTKLLRENGSMLGKITFPDGPDIDWHDPNSENLIAKVSTRQVQTFGKTACSLATAPARRNLPLSLLTTCAVPCLEASRYAASAWATSCSASLPAQGYTS